MQNRINPFATQDCLQDVRVARIEHLVNVPTTRIAIVKIRRAAFHVGLAEASVQN